ncbi:ankyrin repeat domain-containing protein [Paenibacillus spongiae]|uniref:Ankyrin repeat domain-containing protein n=1 Tax=Paenibacillus spongiae TaxID=2909671 RepID=A0ABY5S7R9_9BACL|nr:ankyrin repeat domain-containing protein [Paenibacillus spongiae]UVI29630.1 ankyrin repeat domain-containing protein [Paenibacillus spongiae]
MDEKNREFLDSMSEQDKEVVEQVTQAINNDDAETATLLFQTHSWLASLIDVPCFAFDSPAIVTAASRGNREMVDVLLEHGADINAKSQWWAGGFGVLHHDHHDLSRYLIDRGAHVDPHAAAALGMIELLAKMVEEDPSVVNRRGPDGQVPLHFAKEREIIDFLLAHGADIDMRDIDHNGTPAQWAVNSPEKCRYLVERGAETDIFMACMLDDDDMVHRILETDPNALQAQVGKGDFTSGDSDGGHIYEYTIGTAARPLFLAQRLKRHKVMETMLKYSSTEQKFLLACLQADTATAHSILSGHPNIVASLQPLDESLIVDAAGDIRLDAVRAMLEVGFHVDARRSDRSPTALHAAAIRGNHEIVKYLLSQGASVDAKNEFGGTPLGSCIWGSMYIQDPSGDYAAVAESLIEAGVKLPDQAVGSGDVKKVLTKHGVPDGSSNQG